MPLPDNAPEKWEYREHTKVKLEILSKYLRSWIQILCGKNRNPRVLYFDCFTGRGKYEDGSDGSPLIAMKKASYVQNKLGYPEEVVCIFIEFKLNNNYLL